MTRVLLVDDSLIVRTFLAGTLAGWGFEVEVAEDGPGCLALLEAFHPDLIVCDLQMPGMSGIDVVRELKTRAPLVPVLILTEHSDVDLCVTAMREGATGYVLKGAAEGTLHQEVESALTRQRLEAKNRELEKANQDYQQHLEAMVEEKTREVLALQRVRAQSERMSALGTLVAGVAHEVNNPLAVVKSSLSWMGDLSEELAPLRQLLAEPKAVKRPTPMPWSRDDGEALAEDLGSLPEVLREAGKGVERIVHIVKALKRISKPGQGPSVGRVSEALIDAEFQCRGLLRPEVQFVREVDASLHEAPLSREDLCAALSHLLSNAFHALPASGGHVWLTVRPAVDGGLLLEVRDDGVGISPEQLARVKEPFFTTKDPGKGVGLGLTLTEHLVSAAGGTLTLESTPGQGTLARIVLPPVHRVDAPVEMAYGRLRA